MPDTQISEEMVERGAQVLCGNKPFVTEYYRLLAKAVLEAALSGYAVVPQSALDWLFGEGPDADGKWFGEAIGDGIPKLAGRYPRTYWWRSKFRAMIQAAPPVPEMEG